MGRFAFDLPNDLAPPLRDAAMRGWLSGAFDGIPVPTNRRIDGTRLTCERTEHESSYFSAVWPYADSPRVLSTTTLRLREEPYSTMIELARGAIHRLRQFAGVLTGFGFQLPDHFQRGLKEATSSFGSLAMKLDNSSKAEVAIAQAFNLADEAVAILANYRLKVRKQSDLARMQVGCRLSRPLPSEEQRMYEHAFNAVRIVPDWLSIEPRESQFDWSRLDALVNWAAAEKLHVSIGPLVDLSSGRCPPWLLEWAGDLPNLAAFLSDFLGTLVHRYKDRVRHWQLFAGMNHADVLGLTEDDRLRLSARVLDTVQELDPESDRSFSIAQPWADYLVEEELTYAPYVFADTLLRVGFQVHALEVELLSNVHTPRGGSPRDALDTVHQLELFDNLGVAQEVLVGGVGPEIVTAALGANSMRALHWDTWSAADPCGRTPTAALVDPTGKPLPMLDHFLKLRAEWLA